MIVSRSRLVDSKKYEFLHRDMKMLREKYTPDGEIEITMRGCSWASLYYPKCCFVLVKVPAIPGNLECGCNSEQLICLGNFVQGSEFLTNLDRNRWAVPDHCSCIDQRIEYCTCLEFVTSPVYLLCGSLASWLFYDTRGFGFGGSDFGALGGSFPSQNRADATRIVGCSG
jgi:hypothetical protein